MSSETTARAFAAATAHEFREEDIARPAHSSAMTSPARAHEQLTTASQDVIRNFARSYGEGCPLYAAEDCGQPASAL